MMISGATPSPLTYLLTQRIVKKRGREATSPNGKISLNNVALGFDYKLSINLLMKQLYIDVRYFYVLNRITLEEDCHVVYAPSVNTKSEYLTKTIDGELIDISKLKMNKMNSTESIISKQERL